MPHRQKPLDVISITELSLLLLGNISLIEGYGKVSKERLLRNDIDISVSLMRNFTIKDFDGKQNRT